MPAIKLGCFHCQTELEYLDRVGLREECPKCRSDVHVCKNCEFYDPKTYNECREPQAERIAEKERANRCEYFRASPPGGPVLDKAAQMRAAAEALFKKKS